MSYVPSTPIIKPFCNSGDEVDPPINPSTINANQETGYPPLTSTPLNAGGVQVKRDQTNGIFKFYTKQILDIIAGCRFTFDQDFSDEWGGYPEGVVLYCESNKSYQISLVPNNTFNFVTNPSYVDDGLHWISTQSIYNLKCFNVEIDSTLFLKSLIDPTKGSFLVGNSTQDGQFMLPPLPTIDGQRLIGVDDGGGSILLLWENNTFIDGSIASHSPITTNWFALTSLSLPPGKWALSGIVNFSGPATTVFRIHIGTTTSSTGTDPVGLTLGYNSIDIPLPSGFAAAGASLSQILINNNTGLNQTIYLNANNSATITSTIDGSLKAIYVGPAS